MKITKINIYRNARSLRSLVFIFPLLYLILGFYFRQIFGDLSLRSTDPEYIHFISGMCISTGQFDQANIDHPGSVLQILLAIVFRIVYLFRGGSYSYFEDAMINSDLYLSVANLAITLLISAVMLWAGFATHRITKNYIYALLLQTSPFLINVWYEIYGRIYPELLIIIPVLILQVQILKEIYRDDFQTIKDTLVYSFAIAFGMSLKMTFLPFVFIPLIILNSLKRKFYFIGFSAMFFLILSLPVTFQMEKFWNWMKGIFLHSGAYQSGEKDILDIKLFVNNLNTLIQSEKSFFILLGIFVLGIVSFLIFKSKIEDQKKVLINIGVGLLLMFLGSVFIISKQYAIRYFLPALLFFPFLFILNIEIIRKYINNKNIVLALSILVLFIVLYDFKNHFSYIRITSEGIGNQMAARIKTKEFISTLPEDNYKIIVSQDYGCPYHEYAIMYSFSVAARQWPNYREKLNAIYPNTYQYFTWGNTIKYWGKEFDPNKIIESGKPIYLYLEKNTDELYTRTKNKLLENYPGFAVEKKLLFENTRNGEGILQLYFLSDEGKINEITNATE